MKRFWSKVRITPGGCWYWAGATASGYGSFWIKGRSESAHVVAWTLTHGPVPPGLSVLHRCDHPLCCNPSHLFLGTQLDNIRDMDAKGRRNAARPRRKRPETAKKVPVSEARGAAPR